MSELRQRVERLAMMLGKVEPIPDGWLKPRDKTGFQGRFGLELLPCTEWRQVTTAGRKALHWTRGLDVVLSVMLASVTSTKAVGDAPLWVKAVSPPSSGKTILCEALSTCREYIYPKDTVSGLLSGYQTDKDGNENLSLALRLNGKTLVIKDGDTILQLPNRGQVLAQFRAFYDRALRSQYGNKMSADHEGIYATVILCGTESLRALDDSELGERFLDVNIVDEIDEELEDEVGWRVACQEARSINFQADGKAETLDSPEIVEFRRLTGGYVKWLRENASRLLERVNKPEEALRRCQQLAKFIAHARARPSKRQDESVQRELSYRLVKQLVRLSCCLAVVLNHDALDNEVMARVKKVALDTARGRTLAIMRVLHEHQLGGLETRALGLLCSEADDRLAPFLQFLRQIKVVEKFEPHEGHVKGRARWRLTGNMRRLWEGVMSDGG
jgi:hypothetical protein